MALDPAVRAALESVLASAPDNAAVRIHLASLLADDDPAAALDHASRVLAAHPDHRQGLEIAARTARAVGEEQRAGAYERLLAALVGMGAPAAPVPAGASQAPEPLPAGEILPGEAEIDAFLEEVLGADPDVDRPRITLAPDRPGGHVMLSMVAAQAGRWREVEHHARTALALDPEDTARCRRHRPQRPGGGRLRRGCGGDVPAGPPPRRPAATPVISVIRSGGRIPG